MSIEWFFKEKEISAVTIHNNNITLSKSATSFFVDAYGIIVGIDNETKDLVLKKIAKEQVENNEHRKEDLYMLTIKPSYGRINSKQLVNNIIKHYKLNFNEKTSYKFNAKWNNGLNMLVIKMNGGE